MQEHIPANNTREAHPPGLILMHLHQLSTSRDVMPADAELLPLGGLPLILTIAVAPHAQARP
eukprot:378785-Pelagomonas_calceolata.AAC.1